MKICRFIIAPDAAPQFGAVSAESRLTVINNSIFDEEYEFSERSYALSEVHLQCPVAPSKIVCVGRNYAAHAAELGNEVPREPLLFLKPSTALIADGETIVLPPQSQRVEHEAELAVILKKTAKNISDSENPLSYVLGYACLNDVTARDIQHADVQFTRGKSFDTFCPVGNFIETDLDPANLAIELRVNGFVKQAGSTANMIFPVAELIRYISRHMTLLPGDVIATGTPAGVSPLSDGDLCEIEIEGIGRLSNPVAAPSNGPLA